MKNESLLEKVHKQYQELTEKMIKEKLTVSTMESCTCGLVASLITDTVGASAIFRGGICAYSNDVKIAFHVPSEIIDECGVYSEETAKAMAKAVRVEFASEIAIGVTGSLCTADETNADSVPGEVYLAVTAKTGTVVRKIFVKPALTRFESKLYVAEEACKMLWEITDLIKKT